MRILITILSLSIILSSELEVDGNLKVTGTIENDSLAQVIANLQAQILMMQSHITILQNQLGLVADCEGIVGGDAVVDCNGICNGDNIDCPCEDIDGNQYQTVQIGTQIWMAENLKTTRYRNGDNIPTGLQPNQWATTQSGAYGLYDGAPDNIEKYGYHYNGWAVLDERGICPEGYHPPSLDEMLILMEFVNGDASSLKTNDPGYWEYVSNVPQGTNSSGFNAYPGGWLNEYTYASEYMGQNAHFYTTYEHDELNMGSIKLNAFSNTYEVYLLNRYVGYSVRCLAD